MESIVVYSENEKQKSLIKHLLEEMKIGFEIEINSENPTLIEEDFITKTDRAVGQPPEKYDHLFSETQRKLLKS